MEKTKSAVVVLGNRLKGPYLHEELKGRMDTGIELFEAIDADLLLLSGGRANREVEKSEAQIMEEYAVREGIDPELIVLEERSLDTIGNAYFVRKIVDKEDLDNISTIHVVSSCYHMERAEYIFNQVFGDEYDFEFDECYEEKGKSEDKKLKMNKEFFKGITSGDLDSIKRRLYSEHDLYK